MHLREGQLTTSNLVSTPYRENWTYHGRVISPRIRVEMKIRCEVEHHGRIWLNTGIVADKAIDKHEAILRVQHDLRASRVCIVVLRLTSEVEVLESEASDIAARVVGGDTSEGGFRAENVWARPFKAMTKYDEVWKRLGRNAYGHACSILGAYQRSSCEE